MKTFWKVLIVAGAIGAIALLGYFIMKWTGIDNLETLRQLVDNNIWGMLIFSLILILQVLFLPAGTLFFTGSAVLLFESPLKAWLICWFSLAIGSWIMFWIGRLFGTKVLKWVVGDGRAEKYAKFLGKGKFVLPLILLVPIFPDDIVCLAAGLSNINWLYFMVVVFFTRGIDNFCTVFVGANLIKSTAGIILLVIFVVAMLIASYFLTKHQEKIENFFLNLFTKNKKEEKNKEIMQKNTEKIIEKNNLEEKNNFSVEKTEVKKNE